MAPFNTVVAPKPAASQNVFRGKTHEKEEADSN